MTVIKTGNRHKVNQTPSPYKPSTCGQVYIKSITSRTNISDTSKVSSNDLKYYQDNVRYFLLSKSIQNKFGKQTVAHLLSSEDVNGYLVYMFAKADCYYDPTKGASKQTLRYQAGLWFLYQYLTYRKSAQNGPSSLEHHIIDHINLGGTNSESNFDIVHKNPLVDLLTKEKSQKIDNLLNLPCLTEREKQILHERFVQQDILKAIGINHQISRERARQIIISAIAKIKKYIYEDAKLSEYWQEYLV